MELGVILPYLASRFNVNPCNANEKEVIIRCRHVIKQVLKKCAIAYALSIAQKQCLTFYVVVAREDLLKHLSLIGSDTFEFGNLQHISLQSLRKAIYICSQPNGVKEYAEIYSKSSLAHIGFHLEASSVINRRRKQEDRWFAVADILNYAPHGFPELSELNYSTISAFGVFDGHNGPEIAEHCSHLAPYILSLELQYNLKKDTISLTDILANVFYILNQSANEGRLKKYWVSGTTATICLFVANTILTAWVGDSQAWLYFSNHKPVQLPNNVNDNIHNLANSVDPVTNLDKHQNYKPSTIPSPNKPPTKTHDDGSNRLSQPVAANGFRVVQMNTNPGIRTNPNRDDSYLALTDSLHRPEMAPEFISVLRTGGSVSFELSSPNGSKVQNEIFYTSHKNSLINMTTRVEDSNTKRLTLPPLENSSLNDCRVGLISSVSRSIGDDSTAVGIHALPSITVYTANNSSNDSKPLCLVIASDGLWDNANCSGPELNQVIINWYNENVHTNVVDKSLSDYLIHMAVKNGASDNVTCLVIWLHKWPFLCDEKNNTNDPKGWTVHLSPSASKVRWPYQTRVSSMINLSNNSELRIRGPRGFGTKNVEIGEKNRSSSLDSVGSTSRQVRYSSPPRFKKN